jgi:site-specific recombinase XerC
MPSATAPKAKVPATANNTWRSYQREFLDSLEDATKQPTTIRTYGIAIEQLGQFLQERGMPTDPTAVSGEHIREWVRHMRRPKEDDGQGLTEQTVLQRFRSASRLFSYLLEEGEIRESPMARIKPPKPAEKLVPVIEVKDLSKLLRVVTGSGFEERRDKAIFSLFMDTGMRISEMAGLNLEDIDWDERTIDVLQAKGRRPRKVRFNRQTRQDLQKYVRVRAGHPHAHDEALWLGKRGRLLANGVYRTTQRRCEEAGIAAIHPHQFRHTFADNWLKSGGSEGDLMRLAGWKSRAMTDRYGASAASQRALDAHDAFSLRGRVKG